MISRRLFGISFAALSLAAGGALAQTGSRSKGRDRGGDKGGAREPVDRLEVTLHEFEEDLKLGADQRPAWNDYVGKVRALAGDIARERRQMQSAQMDVLRRIDRAVDSARDRLTALEDIALSAKALHAKLTPEQRALADPRLAYVMVMPFNPSGGGAGEVGLRRGN